MEISGDEILADGLLKKGVKEQNQLEVAIGDGMEFTIHGDLNNKGKKNKQLMNNSKVSRKRAVFFIKINYLISPQKTDVAFYITELYDFSTL